MCPPLSAGCRVRIVLEASSGFSRCRSKGIIAKCVALWAVSLKVSPLAALRSLSGLAAALLGDV